MTPLKLWQAIDSYINRVIKQKSLPARASRQLTFLIYVIFLLIILISPITVLSGLHYGLNTSITYTPIVLILAMVICLILALKTPYYRLPAWLLIHAGIATCFFNALTHGGFHSQALHWLPIISIIGFFFGGAKLGWVAIINVLIGLTILFILERSGYSLPLTLDPSEKLEVDWLNFCTLTISSGTIAFYFDYSLRAAWDTNETTLIQFQEAQRLAGLGELAGGIAHEINNPLAIIYGKTEMLARKLSQKNLDDPMVTQLLDTILANVKRTQLVTKTMLDMTKADYIRHTKALTLVKAIDLARQFFNFHRENHSFQIEWHLAAIKDAEIVGQESQLCQVFLNILNNAKQSFPDHQDHRKILVQGEIIGDKVYIKIRDNGPGVPEEFQAQLFKPLFTTRPKGHGLGLHLSSKIIQAHKGRIYLNTNYKDGAEFVVELPLGSVKK